MKYHLYISGTADGALARFLMDPSTGKLDPRPSIQTPHPVGAMAVDAAGQHLFAAVRSEQSFLAAFAVDRKSGDLTLINLVSIEHGPCYIKTDHTDRNLLYTCYSQGAVAVHPINPDRSIADQPTDHHVTPEHAHSIQTDPSNRFAFVPHTMPPNQIDQFRFDPAAGRLTPNDAPHLELPTPDGPRHFCFHPTRDILYSVNEDGSTVSALHLDPQTGTLEHAQTVSTLPLDADPTDNTCAEIKITPNGQTLYASNRGHDSIAAFTVDPNTGSLTPLAHTSTEPIPRFFDLDPTGQYLFSLGQGNGRLATYQINSATGALTPLESHEITGSPAWLEFIEAK